MPERRGKDLHLVNQNLRDLIDSLRQQRERWQVPRAAEDSTPAPPGRESARARPLAAASSRTGETSLVEERLHERAHELELENQRLYDESVATAEHSTHLANLYVALERLHWSLEHGDVLTAIEEILTGMIGSEEFAILEREADGTGLRLVRGHGASAQRLGAVTLGDGVIGRIAAAGTPYLGGQAERVDAAELVACVPLCVRGEVTGAIVIFELLSHKAGLTSSDGELLQVLSTHAANALYLTSARAVLERSR